MKKIEDINQYVSHEFDKNKVYLVQVDMESMEHYSFIRLAKKIVNTFKKAGITVVVTTSNIIKDVKSLEDCIEEMKKELADTKNANKYKDKFTIIDEMISNCNSMTDCKLPNGEVIHTDMGYVSDFWDAIKQYFNNSKKEE